MTDLGSQPFVAAADQPDLHDRGPGRPGQPGQPAARRRRRPRAPGVFVILALIAVTFVFLTPLLWAAMAATKQTDIAFTSPPKFLYRPTGQAFSGLWLTTNFFHYVINTVIIALIAVVLTLVIAAPAAYALSRRRGRLSAAILAGALVLRATPGFALGLPMYDLANRFHVYDTKTALALAFVAIDQPFSIWLLRGFFAEIPTDLDEAAMVDGCTRLGVFRRIMIPIMTPGLITAAILTFLLAFQEYLLAVVLTDAQAKTVPVFLASQIGQTLPLLQQASAGIVLLTIPIVALAFIAQRYLVAGLTNGAVKG